MKKLIYLLLGFALYACTPKAGEPRLNLNVQWKFTTGDHPDYALPDFQDSGWKEMPVDRIWEKAGFDPYDGFAWYRLKVTIPSTFRTNSHLKDSLRIYLGKINNFDQTFLNGQLIGINGKNALPGMEKDTSFMHAPTNFWDKPRPYTLAADDPRILWDQENVIAIRVYDEGGQGGMHSGGQYIAMTRLTDYLRIGNQDSPFTFSGGKLSKELELRNTSVHYTFEGMFTLEATDKLSGKRIYKSERPVTLAPGATETAGFSIPSPEQSVMVTYRFRIENSKDEKTETDETPYILTPPAPETPRINGPSVAAARPGKPFLFTIPATGLRPMTFEAIGLPEGLTLDGQTGMITGRVKNPGHYTVTLKAINAKGQNEKSLRISIGNNICLTPPMGWNSWNCWGLAVDEQKVMASAREFCNKGLIHHGWTYINIDDGWEIHGDSMPKRDRAGNILTNKKFPDMKRLGDSIHALGLKFGIYSSPGPLTCGGYTASWQHEEQDARSFASWGVDYLKYDWCSYGNIAKDTTLPEYQKPYQVMRAALDRVDRDIVYSLCQYGMARVWEWGAATGGNLWRTTGDITDTWESLREIGFSQTEMQPFAKPGQWNDPDMLIVGWVGWGPNLHPTRLTPDEQYTHISLWSLLASPLLIGCDLERLDEFTLNLLTNDEIIAVNQDTLGIQAKQVVKDGGIQVWVKPLANGSHAFGIFNLSDRTQNYTLNLAHAGLPVKGTIRDLWRQKDLGPAASTLDVSLPSHGVVMYTLK